MGRIDSQPGKRYITKEIILGLLKTGLLLGIAITAPGILKILKDHTKNKPWDGYYPSSIDNIIKKLYRHGFVEIKEEKGQPVVQITDKGQVEVLKYDLDALKIDPPPRWDNKWRMVIFDIEEKYKKVRNLVRGKLKGIGFYQFQESVFVYPYPCEKEIKYLREILHVPHAIKLVRADRIENDAELRKIFHLPG